MPGIFGVDEIERVIIPRKVVPVRSICGVKEKTLQPRMKERRNQCNPGKGCIFSHFERLR